MSAAKKIFVLKTVDASPIILGLPLGQFMVTMLGVVLIFLMALKNFFLALGIAAVLFAIKKLVLDKGLLNEKKLIYKRKNYIVSSSIFIKNKSTLS